MTRRRALLATGLLIVLIKAVEFTFDSQVLFCSDSAAYILNALRVLFISFRSYVYGEMIRAFALPFHSLKAIVAMQMIIGALTAWLFVVMLLRFFRATPWIAIGAAIVFSIDPVQVFYEHMVMTETVALLATVVFLIAVLEYLRRRALGLLPVISLVGIMLVSLRFVYLPLVLAATVLVPVAGWWPLRGRYHSLALALTASCASTALVHLGYQHVTGWLAKQEPAYHDRTGFFLLTVVAPLLSAPDSPDPHVAEVIAAQSKSRLPLNLRTAQLWAPDGLVSRLIAAFDGNIQQANQAALRLARSTIRRHPIGFVRLAVTDYVAYWTNLPDVRSLSEMELRTDFFGLLSADHVPAVSAAFKTDDVTRAALQTPSRRYHLMAASWYVFLLLAPFITIAAFALESANRKGIAVLCVWNLFLMCATCFGETEIAYRYLHPYSLTGLAGIAVLARIGSNSISNNP